MRFRMVFPSVVAVSVLSAGVARAAVSDVFMVTNGDTISHRDVGGAGLVSAADSFDDVRGVSLNDIQLSPDGTQLIVTHGNFTQGLNINPTGVSTAFTEDRGAAITSLEVTDANRAYFVSDSSAAPVTDGVIAARDYLASGLGGGNWDEDRGIQITDFIVVGTEGGGAIYLATGTIIQKLIFTGSGLTSGGGWADDRGTTVTDLEWDAVNNMLYYVYDNGSGGSVIARRGDAGTGLGAGSLAAFDDDRGVLVNDIELDVDDNLIYYSYGTTLAVRTLSGSGLGGPIGWDDDLGVTVGDFELVIPEPASLALLGLGGVLVLSRRRVA